MKATEAHKIAKKQSGDELRYIGIQIRIHDAAQKGSFYVWYYNVIPEATRERLIKDGYKISTEYDKNDSLTKIEW